MSLRFHDPRVEPSADVDRYERRLDPAVTAPVFGVLANGFLDSEVFAALLGQALTGLRPDAELMLESKGDAAAIVGGERLERMAERCHAVVCLYGH